MDASLLPLSLTLVTGICWVVVYLESIRVGFSQKTCAMPFWALALNFAWEFLHTFSAFGQDGFSLQVVINGAWCVFDIGLMYTYFRYGRKHFPQNLDPDWFISWSLMVIATSFMLQYAFIVEFGSTVGRQFSAFLQNLLMSVLFINMLVRRGGSEGQNLVIAINKWIGTLAATLSYGVLTAPGFPKPSFLILVSGMLCTVFDLLYIVMLAKVRSRERQGEVSPVLW